MKWNTSTCRLKVESTSASHARGGNSVAILLVILLWILAEASGRLAFGARVSPEQALQAAQAFIAITYPVASHNDTKTVAAARQSSRAVQQVRPLVEEGQNIGYVADLDGTGYVLLSADDGAPPIKCHSEEGSFDRLPPGFLAVLKLELAEDLSVLAEMNQAKRTAGKTAGIVSTEYTAQWQELLNPGLTSKTTTPALFAAAGTYLLTTKWDQGSPYILLSRRQRRTRRACLGWLLGRPLCANHPLLGLSPRGLGRPHLF